MMELQRYKMEQGDGVVFLSDEDLEHDQLTENMFRYHAFEHLYRPLPAKKDGPARENVRGKGVLERLKEEGSAVLDGLEDMIREACREIDEYMIPDNEIVWDFRYMYFLGEQMDKIGLLCVPCKGLSGSADERQMLLDVLKNGRTDGFQSLARELLSRTADPVPMIRRLKTGEDIRIDQPEFIIGKSRNRAHYAVDNKTVSREHAVIRSCDGEYTLEDKGSTNGTFIHDDKTPIPPGQPAALRPQDRFVLSDEAFCFMIRRD